MIKRKTDEIVTESDNDDLNYIGVKNFDEYQFKIESLIELSDR